jgi:hypothetical protein
MNKICGFDHDTLRGMNYYEFAAISDLLYTDLSIIRLQIKYVVHRDARWDDVINKLKS